VGDRATERRVLGALWINVDPLVVASCLREEVNPRLIDFQPVGATSLCVSQFR
jgi:hypothetical protein